MPLPPTLAENLAPLDLPAEPPDVEVTRKRIVLRLDEQELDEWCWAAIASAVDRYYAGLTDDPDDWVGQCVVASRVTTEVEEADFECCPSELAPLACNQQRSVTIALRQVGHSGRNFEHPVGFETIKGQIKDGHPLVARIQWNGSTRAHFVLITGYKVEDGEEVVIYKDPRYSPDSEEGNTYELPLWWFQNEFDDGQGQWTHTDFTSP